MSRAGGKKSRRAHEEQAPVAPVAAQGDADVSLAKPWALAEALLNASRSGAASAAPPDDRAAVGTKAAPPDEAAGEAEARLRELSGCLSRRYKEIELLTGLLSAAEGERDDLKGRWEATTAQLLTMQHERNCLAAELSRAQAARSELESALDAREASLLAITSSRSWRLTQPMRRLRLWIKG